MHSNTIICQQKDSTFHMFPKEFKLKQDNIPDFDDPYKRRESVHEEYPILVSTNGRKIAGIWMKQNRIVRQNTGGEQLPGKTIKFLYLAIQYREFDMQRTLSLNLLDDVFYDASCLQSSTCVAAEKIECTLKRIRQLLSLMRSLIVQLLFPIK